MHSTGREKDKSRPDIQRARRKANAATRKEKKNTQFSCKRYNERIKKVARATTKQTKTKGNGSSLSTTRKVLSSGIAMNMLWMTLLYNTTNCGNYRSSRRRFGGPWSGPLKALQFRGHARRDGSLACLFRLSVLSAKITYPLFLLSLYSHDRAIPFDTVLHHCPGSSAVVLHPSPYSVPSIRKSFATQSIHSFSLPLAHAAPPFPGFLP